MFVYIKGNNSFDKFLCSPYRSIKRIYHTNFSSLWRGMSDVTRQIMMMKMMLVLTKTTQKNLYPLVVPCMACKYSDPLHLLFHHRPEGIRRHFLVVLLCLLLLALQGTLSQIPLLNEVSASEL